LLSGPFRRSNRPATNDPLCQSDRGKLKAVWAVAHSIIVIICQILFTKQSYQDLGKEYFNRLEAPCLQRHHVHQLEQLGNTVTLSPRIA